MDLTAPRPGQAVWVETEVEVEGYPSPEFKHFFVVEIHNSTYIKANLGNLSDLVEKRLTCKFDYGKQI